MSSFFTLVESKLQASPCTPFAPWRIVLYADEVTPGAVLKAVNTRKCWAWYFTFLEFGSQHIAREELWIPFGILRSGITKLVKGGFRLQDALCGASLVQAMTFVTMGLSWQ